MCRELSLVVVALLCAIVTSSMDSSAAVAARHAQNLNQAQKVIRSNEGKSAWNREMEGKENTSLGVKLPPGVSKDDLSNMLFGKPIAQIKKDDLQGPAAIPYPGRPGLFIAAGGIKANVDDMYYINYTHVSLAVFKIENAHKLTVVAKTVNPLTFDTGREIKLPAKDSFYFEDELVKLDKAPFQVKSNETAFGIRLAHHEGYAGGFGYAEFLHLFTVQGNEIKPLFSSLIYDLQNLAGDWNSDQTRQHTVIENKYVLVVGPPMPNDEYRNLSLRQTAGGRYKGTFRWNPGSASYDPIGKIATVFSDN